MRLCAMTLMAASLFTGSALAQVTFERILNSSKEPQNWLTYSGDYEGRRFSALDQINSGNVKNLAPRWVYQTGALGKFETTPLVVDGVLYGTAQDTARSRSMHGPAGPSGSINISILPMCGCAAEESTAGSRSLGTRCFSARSMRTWLRSTQRPAA